MLLLLFSLYFHLAFIRGMEPWSARILHSADCWTDKAWLQMTASSGLSILVSIDSLGMDFLMQEQHLAANALSMTQRVPYFSQCCSSSSSESCNVPRQFNIAAVIVSSIMRTYATSVLVLVGSYFCGISIAVWGRRFTWCFDCGPKFDSWFLLIPVHSLIMTLLTQSSGYLDKDSNMGSVNERALSSVGSWASNSLQKNTAAVPRPCGHTVSWCGIPVLFRHGVACSHSRRGDTTWTYTASVLVLVGSYFCGISTAVWACRFTHPVQTQTSWWCSDCISTHCDAHLATNLGRLSVLQFFNRPLHKLHLLVGDIATMWRQHIPWVCLLVACVSLSPVFFEYF